MEAAARDHVGKLPAILIAAAFASSCVAQQRWELQADASLISPRAVHQVVALSPDELLIMGGCADTSCRPILASTEFYDVRARTARPGAPMHVPRVSHTVVRLDGGDVLVIGGWTGSSRTGVIERFDRRSRRFEVLVTSAAPRMDAIAIALGNDRVLIAGGSGSEPALSTAEILNAATRTITATGDLHEARTSFAATRLNDGRVLLTGGLNKRRSASASAEVFDPATNTFRAVASMATARYKHAAVKLRDGRVLVIAGSSGGDESNRLNTTEIYDPVLNQFSRGPSLLSARFKIPSSAVVLPSGDVMIAGGADDVEVWTPGDAAFRRATGTFGTGYEFASATALSDGSVLVMGGYDSQIKPTAKTWRVVRARSSAGS